MVFLKGTYSPACIIAKFLWKKNGGTGAKLEASHVGVPNKDLIPRSFCSDRLSSLSLQCKFNNLMRELNCIGADLSLHNLHQMQNAMQNNLQKHLCSIADLCCHIFFMWNSSLDINWSWKLPKTQKKRDYLEILQAMIGDWIMGCQSPFIHFNTAPRHDILVHSILYSQHRAHILSKLFVQVLKESSSKTLHMILFFRDY